MGRSYRVKAHTADVIIRADGARMEGLFRNLHRALYIVIFGKVPRPKAPGNAVAFRLTAPTPEDLVVDFINEIAYHIFTRRALLKLPGEVECLFTNVWEVRAKYAAVDLAVLKSVPEIEVKSATYHRLKVHYDGGKFKTAVVLDI
jgi:SHS2 domain-containing protein